VEELESEELDARADPCGICAEGPLTTPLVCFPAFSRLALISLRGVIGASRMDFSTSCSSSVSDVDEDSSSLSSFDLDFFAGDTFLALFFFFFFFEDLENVEEEDDFDDEEEEEDDEDEDLDEDDEEDEEALKSNG
jgi:hypothetical protein